MQVRVEESARDPWPEFVLRRGHDRLESGRLDGFRSEVEQSLVEDDIVNNYSITIFGQGLY